MTTASGRGRPRDAAVDLAILRAGLDLFIERGVEGTSMEQIAKNAGVGKPTIYRRWTSKEELIAAAIELLVADDAQWAAPEQIDVESPYELVEAIIDRAAVTAATPQYRALVARVFGSAVSHPELMAAYWERYILPRRRLAARLLIRARRLGSASTVADDAGDTDTDADLDADVDADVAIDMIVGAVTYRVLQPDPPDVEEMRRYLRAVYRQVGLLPP